MSSTATCPICNGNKCTPAYTGRAHREGWQDGRLWQVWSCSDCTHSFLHPQPSMEMLSGYYNKAYAPYEAGHGVEKDLEDTIREARATGHYRHVDISPGMTLLDVGCGGGSYLRVAKAMGADVQGVEPSEHGVATCRAQNIPVFHGTLTEFVKTNPGPYDLITANHVIEHHPDPVGLLSEMRLLLAPKGRIWISAPNAGCFFSWQLKDYWHSADLPVHLHHFTAASMHRAMSAAGLTVQTLRTESENSLSGSLATLLRRRLLVPGRITQAMFRQVFSKRGVLGQRIDEAGHGEALLVQAAA